MKLGFAALDVVEKIVDLGETSHGDLEGRQQLGFLIWLGDVRHGSRTGSLLDQIGLGERRKHDHRGDVLVADDAGRLDAVHARHLDVHAHHAWTELTGEIDRFLAIGGLTDNLITVVFEHCHQVHTVHGFILGDDNGALVGVFLFRGMLRFGCGLKLFGSEHFVRFNGLLCRHVISFHCHTQSRPICPNLGLDCFFTCPRWDSNPHCADFEAASSTNWDTRAFRNFATIT